MAFRLHHHPACASFVPAQRCDCLAGPVNTELDRLDGIVGAARQVVDAARKDGRLSTYLVSAAAVDQLAAELAVADTSGA